MIYFLIALYFIYVWDARQQRKNKYVRGKKYTFKR